MQTLWPVKVQVNMEKSQSQGTHVTIGRVTRGTIVHMYSADMETPWSCHVAHRTYDRAGDMAFVQHRWTNCILTRGNDGPMRIFHVVASH
jgi:hypothetical protein